MPRPRVEGQSDDAADVSFRLRGLRRVVQAPVATLDFSTEESRRVLLIHGYNVGEQSGVGSMAELRRNVGRRSETLRSQSFTVTWPGNKALHVGGPAAYPRVKNVAIEVGDTLFRYLMAEYDRGRGSEQLIIVAHSLGCRVTLEFLQRMDRAKRPKRLKQIVVILMAAAVPIELDALIRDAVRNANYVVALHSSDDWVLKAWFRLGQTVAREGVMPEAVGLHGLPADPGWAEVRQMVGFGHGDYWTSDETAEVVCLALRRFLPDVVLRNDVQRARILPFAAQVSPRDFLALHDLARWADAVRT